MLSSPSSVGSGAAPSRSPQPRPVFLPRSGGSRRCPRPWSPARRLGGRRNRSGRHCLRGLRGGCGRMDADEVTIREQNFHSQVREYTVRSRRRRHPSSTALASFSLFKPRVGCPPALRCRPAALARARVFVGFTRASWRLAGRSCSSKFQCGESRTASGNGAWLCVFTRKEASGAASH